MTKISIHPISGAVRGAVGVERARKISKERRSRRRESSEYPEMRLRWQEGDSGLRIWCGASNSMERERLGPRR